MSDQLRKEQQRLADIVSYSHNLNKFIDDEFFGYFDSNQKLRNLKLQLKT